MLRPIKRCEPSPGLGQAEKRGLRFWVLGFRVLWFRVKGSGFRVLGLRV